MTLIAVISTENDMLCGSIMPVIMPINFCKSLFYKDFIRLADDIFVARRHRSRRALLSVDGTQNPSAEPICRGVLRLAEAQYWLRISL